MSLSSSMKRYGKSYYVATLFFPREEKEKVFVLYDFVRRFDNIVDEPQKDDAIAVQELKKLFDDRKNVYQKKLFDDEIFGAFGKLCREKNIDQQWIQRFFDAMMLDTQKKFYPTFDELQHYMYGSAEVIGLMMCRVLDIPEVAYPAAQALGTAMQLTNFLRDVREDWLDYGRIYLPEDDLKKYGITHELLKKNIHDKKNTDAFKKFMKEEISHTRKFYQQAREGFSLIPKKFRKPIQIATLMYEGILDNIERIDYDVCSQSAKTSLRRKLFVLGKYFFSRF